MSGDDLFHVYLIQLQEVFTMMALVGGLIALILGIVGIIVWWGYFLKALMAGVPVMLILGGALATYLGVEEIKDKKASESFETEKDDLKREVDTLKQEIKDLKEKDGENPAS